MKEPTATARLQAVVEKCGRPEAATLWMSPKGDRSFQKARTENRVLTIKQETVGTKKDFGLVGFHKEQNVSYWIFPKPLDQFEGRKIVGIRYDALREPGLQEATLQGTRKGRPIMRDQKHRPRRNGGAPFQFQEKRSNATVSNAAPRQVYQVIVRCVATVEVTHEVEAASLVEAKSKALELAANRSPNYALGKQTQKVIQAERAAGREANESPAARFRRLRGLPLVRRTNGT